MISRNADPLEGKRISQRYKINSVDLWQEHAVFCTGVDLEQNKNISIILIDQNAISDLELFEKLARKKARLKHPNVVQVVDNGKTQEEEPFIALDAVGVKALSQTLSVSSVYSAKQAVDIIISLIDGLTYLSTNGEPADLPLPDRISITPGNPISARIMSLQFSGAISQDNLLLTKASTEIEAASFSPPEYFKDKKIDARSQIYTLGCLLYRFLTGVNPFESDDLVELQSQHLCVPPKHFHVVKPDSYISPPIEKCVLKALSKDPAQRQESLAQFKVELQEALQKRPWWQKKWKEVACLILACGAAAYGSGAIIQPFWITENPPVDLVNNPPAPVEQPPVQQQSSNLIPEVPANAKDLGFINMSGSETKTLSAGDYKCSGIQLLQNSKLNSNGKVNLWIVPADGKPSIKLSDKSELCSSSEPDNLAIYYGGSDQMMMTGDAKLKAHVTAPFSLLDASGHSTIDGVFTSAGQKLTDKARFVGGPEID